MNNQVRIAKITAKYLTRHGIRFANAEDVERFFVKSAQILKKQAGLFDFWKKNSDPADATGPDAREVAEAEKKLKQAAEVKYKETVSLLDYKYVDVLNKLEAYGIVARGSHVKDLNKTVFTYAGGQYSFKDLRNRLTSEIKANPKAKETLANIESLYVLYEARVVLDTNKAPRGVFSKLFGKIGSFFESLAEFFNLSALQIILGLVKAAVVVSILCSIALAMGAIAGGAGIGAAVAAVLGFGGSIGAFATAAIHPASILGVMFVILGKNLLVWLARKTGNLFSSMGFRFAGQRSAMYRQTARALYYAR
jgi:hypothetical protein